MNSISPDTPLRQCPTCGQSFPATTEFFYVNSSAKSGLAATCKACTKARVKAYANAHDEQTRARAKHYRETHKEEMRNWKKQHYQENREPIRAKHRAYAQTHKRQAALRARRYQQETQRPRHLAYHRQHYQENKEPMLAQMRQHYQVHSTSIRARVGRYSKSERGRLVHRAHWHKRRLQANGKHYTSQQLQEQLQRQKRRCYYCAAKLERKWHADHIVPLSKGGTNDISNIVIACPSCNLSKGAKFLHEWDGSGGRLL